MVDEEESLEMVLEAIKGSDCNKMEGLFFSLSCLCHDMQYIENEDLLSVEPDC